MLLFFNLGRINSSLFTKLFTTLSIMLFTAITAIAQSEKKLETESFFINAYSDFDIHGEFVVVGSNLEGSGVTQNTTATVYKYESGKWRNFQEIKYVGSSSVNVEKTSVSIHGESIVIGIPKFNVAEIYSYNESTGLFTRQYSYGIDFEYSGQQFGYDVDIFDSTIVIGAPNYAEDDFTNDIKTTLIKGAIYISHFNNENWSTPVRVDKDKWIRGNTGSGTYSVNSTHRFGTNIEVNDAYIAVKSEVVVNDFENWNREPKAYYNKFYLIENITSFNQLVDLTVNSWNGEYASEMEMNNRFLIINEPDRIEGNKNGFAYIHDLSVLDTDRWIEDREVFYIASNNILNYGAGVSIESYQNSKGNQVHYAAIGADMSNVNYNNSGSVFLYKYNELGNWVRIDDTRFTITPNPEDNKENAFFGSNISSYNGKLMVSSDIGDNGSFYVYDLAPNSPHDVNVSKAEFTDEIKIDWKHKDHSEPYKTDGFYVYDHTDMLPIDETTLFTFKETVDPGEIKSYAVAAYNEYGKSEKVHVVGKALSNRTISGKISAPVASGGGGIGKIDLKIRNKGNSVNLNGTLEQYLVSSYLDDFVDSSFTIECWVKPGAGEGAIFSYANKQSDNALLLHKASNNRIQAIVAGESSKYSKSNIQDGVWTHLALTWDSESGNLNIYIDGVPDTSFADYAKGISIEPGGVLYIGQEQDLLGGGLAANQAFEGNIDEMRVWTVARSSADIKKYYNRTVPGKEPGLFSYWKFDEKNDSKVIYTYDNAYKPTSEDVNLFINNASFVQGADFYNVVTTNNEDVANKGNYKFSDLSYSAEDSFVVYPDTTGNRSFEPDSAVVVLNDATPERTELNFTDMSSFTVRSSVQFTNTNCPVEGIQIIVSNSNPAVETDTVETDANGQYEVTLQSGEYTITPEYENHSFSPSSYTESLSGLSEGLHDFEDITTRTVSGKVVAGSCDYPFGTAKIIIQFPASCSDSTVTIYTSDNGEGIETYSVDIPAFIDDVIIRVDSVDNEEWDLIKAGEQGYFVTTKNININKVDTTLDFIYRTKPELLLITGEFPTDGCALPVFEQSQSYGFQFQLTEPYETGTTTVYCPVGNYGTITVFDDISDREEQVLKTDTAGSFDYVVRSGMPNIISGGNHPYQKKLQFIAEVQDGGAVDFTQWVYVEGARPREKTFTTVSPEIPLLILRDPPGDGSSSTISESSTTCFASGLSLQTDKSLGINNQLYAGTKFSVGFGYEVETEITATLGKSFETGISTLSLNEHEMCITTTTEFSTSDEDDFTGDDADVFVGAALNIAYAITDVLEIQGCSPVLSKSLTYGLGGDDGEPFQTTYVYTAGIIKEKIIPDLEELASIDPDPEQQQKYMDQIEVWQQTLDYNDNLKANSTNLEVYNGGSNISMGAGTQVTKEFETTVSKSNTFEFNMYIANEVATEIGLDVGGLGYSFGVQARASFEQGYSLSTLTENSRTVGFTLTDDDPNDILTMDVKIDPVYATPVFDLLSGTTECPHEEGTQPREGVQLTVDKNRIVDIDPDELAVFRLTLGNTTQSGEEKDYLLTFLQSSNPDGAELRIGGSEVQAGTPIPYTIEALGSVDATMTVARGPVAYDYDNLQVVLGSACDESIADTVTFDAHFTSPCSDIALFRPENGWVVNQLNAEKLKLILNDYDLDLLTAVTIDYSASGKNNWKTGLILTGDDLDENNTIIYWDASQLEDGEYDIRASLECASGIRYSEIVTGIIDKSAPQLFGNPEPADGRYRIGDEISATFNKEIKCGSVSSSTVKLIDVETETKLDIDVTCNGDKIIITPVTGLQDYDRNILKVEVSGISDENDNSVTEAISWTFAVTTNPLYWELTELRNTMYEGSRNNSNTIKLYNSSNQPIDYTISSLPAWLTTGVTAGSIAAFGYQSITLNYDQSLAIGSVNDTIIAKSTGGDSKLYIENTILGNPPVSDAVTISEDSVIIAAQIGIQGISIAEKHDILYAYSDDKLIGKREFVKSVPWDEYVAFITLYGQSVNDTIRFTFWDASENKLFTTTDTVFGVQITGYEFNVDSLNVLELTASDFDVQKVQVYEGWNWISFKTDLGKGDVNDVLKSLNPGNGAVIKGDKSYSQYVTGKGWTGPLALLEMDKGYKIRLFEEDELINISATPSTTNSGLVLHEGWNWIGSSISDKLGIDSAFTSLNQDTIILMRGFNTSFYDSTDWVGDIDQIIKGYGYMLYVHKSDTLWYPGMQGSLVILSDSSYLNKGNYSWNIDHNRYESEMLITGKVNLFGSEVDIKNSVIGLYKNDTCVGFSESQNVAGEELFYLYVYGNDEHDTLAVKLTDYSIDKVFELGEVLFHRDTLIGTPTNPYAWNLILEDAEIINEAPFDILLSNTQIATATSAGSLVAIIDAKDNNPADEHTFSLVNGLGSDDNSMFTVEGQLLKLSSAPTGKSQFSIRLRTTDAKGASYEKVFALQSGNPSSISTGFIPDGFTVSQNYPNPAVAGQLTWIDYSLPENGYFRFDLFSIDGKLIHRQENKNQPAGKGTVSFDTSRLKQGIYIYRIQFEQYHIVRKMSVK